jgi:hypothetical protein
MPQPWWSAGMGGLLPRAHGGRSGGLHLGIDGFEVL